MMCQCWFANCNKCSALTEHVDDGRGYECEWAAGIWEISALSAQYYYANLKPV